MSAPYVTIEGIDGAGKTTVANELAEALPGDPLVTTEPNPRSWVGEGARRALSEDLPIESELFLFAADRAEHVKRTVEPALEDGRPVVSDRGYESTYAYKTARLHDAGVPDPWAWIDELYAPWNVQPDLTVYLDITVAESLDRTGRSPEHYEGDARMLEEARRNYSRLADRYSHRWTDVDASRPPEEVTSAAVTAVLEGVDAGPIRAAADGGGRR